MGVEELNDMSRRTRKCHIPENRAPKALPACVGGNGSDFSFIRFNKIVWSANGVRSAARKAPRPRWSRAGLISSYLSVRDGASVWLTKFLFLFFYFFCIPPRRPRPPSVGEPGNCKGNREQGGDGQRSRQDDYRQHRWFQSGGGGGCWGGVMQG